MNVAITGGRAYRLTPPDYQFLERTLILLRATAIYTDGGSGVPEQIEKWAKSRGLVVHRVTANFMHDGPATPQERNTSIVVLVRAVIAFPGEDHVGDLVAKTRKARRPVHESVSRQLANLTPNPSTGPTPSPNRPKLKP